MCEEENKQNVLYQSLINIIYILIIFRYKLPIVIVVINNNGIYGGVDESTWAAVSDFENLPEMYVKILC